MSKSVPGKQPTLEEVTLRKPHTHQGVSMQPGDKVRVDAADKAWLLEHHIIEPDAK